MKDSRDLLAFAVDAAGGVEGVAVCGGVVRGSGAALWGELA